MSSCDLVAQNQVAWGIALDRVSRLKVKERLFLHWEPRHPAHPDEEGAMYR